MNHLDKDRIKNIVKKAAKKVEKKNTNYNPKPVAPFVPKYVHNNPNTLDPSLFRTRKSMGNPKSDQVERVAKLTTWAEALRPHCFNMHCERRVQAQGQAFCGFHTQMFQDNKNMEWTRRATPDQWGVQWDTVKYKVKPDKKKK